MFFLMLNLINQRHPILNLIVTGTPVLYFVNSELIYFIVNYSYDLKTGLTESV
jgi:hypothetical protein